MLFENIAKIKSGRIISIDSDEIRKEFSLKEAKKIGSKIGIDFGEIKIDQFQKGLNVELEHGYKFASTNITDNDSLMTGKIALVHLLEIPDYYDRLEKMEDQAKKEEMKDTYTIDPFTKKGNKIMKLMIQEYGEKRGEEAFYASRNAGKIKGVDSES